MNRRLRLVVLLVVSTAAFVVGVSVERSSGDSHDEPVVTAASSEAAESDEEHADERAEGEASESAVEADSEGAAGEAGQDEDESVLGVDLEATPFVLRRATRWLACQRGQQGDGAPLRRGGGQRRPRRASTMSGSRAT